MKYLSLVLLPALFVFSAVGCAGKPARRPPSQAKTASSENPYANLQTVAGYSHIVDTDPKTGKILWEADVPLATLQAGEQASALTGTFHDVHGVFYANGKPADRFTAPLVTANNASQTVVATGGVTVTSITQAGAKLRADKMTWYSHENKLIGVGHVVFTKGGITQTMPSFQADTLLKKIVTPAPGLGGPAGGRPIHARIEQRQRHR